MLLKFVGKFNLFHFGGAAFTKLGRNESHRCDSGYLWYWLTHNIDHVQWLTIWNCWSTSWMIHIHGGWAKAWFLTNFFNTPGAPNGFSPQSKRCRPPTVGVCTNIPAAQYRMNLAQIIQITPRSSTDIYSKSAISPTFLSKISSLRLEKPTVSSWFPKIHPQHPGICKPFRDEWHEYSWNYQPVIYII